MLAFIQNWYGQSSNQVALGGLFASVGALASHQISPITFAGTLLGFFAVALKNETQATTVTTTPAVVK